MVAIIGGERYWAAVVASSDGEWREELDPFEARDLDAAWAKARDIVRGGYDEGTRVVAVEPFQPQLRIISKPRRDQ